MALTNFWYSFAILPIKTHIKFPGNMGEGIKSEAAKNIEKKTINIGIPFTVFPLCAFHESSGVVIFINISAFMFNKNTEKRLIESSEYRKRQNKDPYQNSCYNLSSGR